MPIENRYEVHTNDPAQPHPFDPAGDNWLETDQGMETNELIERLFKPEDVVRMSVTVKPSNQHKEKTVCAIEGKAKKMLSSFEEIPGILTALVGKWTGDMSISLNFNPVRCDSMFKEYPNAAIVIEGMDSDRYEILVNLIYALHLPVVAILCGDVSVMYVRVNATDRAEYMDRVNFLIDEIKIVSPEMEWAVKAPEDAVPIPRSTVGDMYCSIYYPVCGTPPVEEWAGALFSKKMY